MGSCWENVVVCQLFDGIHFSVIRCQRIGDERKYEEIEIEIPKEVYKRFDTVEPSHHQTSSKSIRSKYEQFKRRFVKV